MRRIARYTFFGVLLGLAILTATAILNVAPPRDSSMVSTNLKGEAVLNALKALTQEERLQLMEREKRALSANLMDKKALLNLSILSELQNDSERSNRLIVHLSKYSLRDPETQFAAMNQLFAEKDYGAAIERADALLRAHPTLQDQVFPALYQFLQSGKQTSTLVAATLAKSPSWRGSFFAQLLKVDPSGQLAYQLLTELRAINDPVRDTELRSLLAMLIKAGKDERAYFVWLDALNSDDLRKVTSIFDGNFTLEPRNLMFDWTWTQQKNVKTAVVLRPGSSSDRALLVDFFDFKGRFSGVSQLLRLDPGNHVLKFESMAENFSSAGGLVWRARCLQSGSIIGESKTFAENGPWANYEFDLSVPSAGCATQTLRLEMSSGAVLDSKTSGSIYFDKFSVTTKKSVENEQSEQ